ARLVAGETSRHAQRAARSGTGQGCTLSRASRRRVARTELQALARRDRKPYPSRDAACGISLPRGRANERAGRRRIGLSRAARTCGPREARRRDRKAPQQICTEDGELEGSSAPCRRSEEHTSELQSRENLVCRLLLEKKKQNK